MVPLRADIEFNSAPVLPVGGWVTSSNWNALMDAFGDRMKSGIGDPCWRIWYAAHSIVRNITTANGDTLPSQDEWWSDYMHIDPAQLPNADWPVDPAVPNYYNPLMGFVFGLPDDGADPYFTQSEPERLAGLSAAGLGWTSAAYWESAKIQRGAVAGDVRADTACAAARNWRRLKADMAGVNGRIFLQTFGGWMPAPLSTVYSTDENGNDVWTNDEWRFVHLTDPPLTNTYDPIAWSVSLNLDHYFLYSATATQRLYFNEWLLGPYTNATPLQGVQAFNFDVADEDGELFTQTAPPAAWGRQLDAMLDWFVNEYKGDAAQREVETRRIKNLAFDFERYFTNQYRLAPARGTVSGTNVAAVYPDLTLPAGSAGRLAAGYSASNGFVLAGFKLWLQGGSNAAVPVQVIGSSLVVASNWQVVATGVTNLWSGTATTNPIVIWLDPEGALSVNFSNRTSFTNGTIHLELAELERRKPTLEDAYLCLRLFAAGNGSVCDGFGTSVETPHRYSDMYFTNGCLVNDNSPLEAEAINHNPAYEACRQQLRKNLRFIRSTHGGNPSSSQFEGYSTNGSGQAVLRFVRHIYLSGQPLDTWDGIAPPLTSIPSGKLLSKQLYAVSNAPVVYAGSNYAAGATFVATNGVTTFVTTNGTVWQVDGIITDAPANGLDNQWTVFISSSCYNDSAESILKEDVYGEALPFLNNHGLFLDNYFLQYQSLWPLWWLIDPGFRQAVDTGADLPNQVLVAQAPSYFTYTAMANSGGDTNWYRANPIYPKPYVLTSVRNDGADVVVTLDRDLDYAEPFPPSTTPANTPRCDKNTITDFLRLISQSVACPPRAGDHSQSIADNLAASGSCEPRWYFTRLPPKAYEDQNNVTDRLDTRVFSEQLTWLTFLLQSICEGWVADDADLSSGNCRWKPVFTFENLMYRANGSRWMDTLPAKVRPDKQESAGPIVNTKVYADYFNRISRAVNLLVNAPIELPAGLQTRRGVSGGLYAQQAASIQNDLFGTWPYLYCSDPVLQTNLGTVVMQGGYLGIDNLISAGGSTNDSYSSTNWADWVPTPDGFLLFNTPGLVCDDTGGGEYRVILTDNMPTAYRHADFYDLRLAPGNPWLECLRPELKAAVASNLVLNAWAVSERSWWERDDSLPYEDASYPPDCTGGLENGTYAWRWSSTGDSNGVLFCTADFRIRATNYTDVTCLQLTPQHDGSTNFWRFQAIEVCNSAWAYQGNLCLTAPQSNTRVLPWNNLGILRCKLR